MYPSGTPMYGTSRNFYLAVAVPPVMPEMPFATAWSFASLQMQDTPPAMNLRFNSDGLPIRPSQKPCSYYMETGHCKYGKACKWHHPEWPSPPARSFASLQMRDTPPAMNPRFNSDGLPIRPSQKPCSYYMETGHCKYGKACKWHHPEWPSQMPVMPMAKSKDQGKMVWKPKVKPLTSEELPIRPSQMSCSYQMKNGRCGYGEKCKWHHPERPSQKHCNHLVIIFVILLVMFGLLTHDQWLGTWDTAAAVCRADAICHRLTSFLERWTEIA